MSRSYKKTPIHGNTTARSEKQDKRHANRKLRRKPIEDFTTIPIKKFEDNWGWAKDGRTYADKQWYIKTGWLDYYRKMMRK